AEALGWYEKAVDIYAERGFLNNAIALCNKVLRQSPSRAAVYYKLGKISASKGFKSDAKKNFIEYADRMQKAGQIDEAFRALKEFADLCPDQDDIRLMLAEWLTRENRKSEAVEQLETLWNKFESEGRRPEASATLGRMKALDPEFMPKASGAWVAQKSSDLVFLDLAVEAPAARAVSETPPNVKSRSPSPSAVPVVAALEGLTLMFHPDEEDVHGASHHPDGFQEADALQLVEPNESMAGLEAMELESTPDFGTDALAQMGLLPNADRPGATSEFAAHVAAIDGLTNAEPSALDFVDGEVDGVENDERGGGRFISLDLDAVMAQPPRTQEIALEVDLPVLVPIDESTSSDAAHIDLLRILGTPIGTPAIALTPLESLAPLDLLDLGHDHPANDNVSASSVAPEDARSVASAADVDAAANEIEIVAADSHGHVTSELVAIDASARVTDELLVVETDEESDLADAHADLATDDAAAESSRASGGHGRMLDGDVTPDAWVEAALGSRRDDLTFDRLLTPLGVPVISAEIDPQDRIGSRSIEAPPLAVLPSDIEAAKAESHDFDEFGTLPKQVDEVSSESCSTVSFGLTNAGAESNAAAA
ncbi:MAG: hypothetical protein ABIT38_24390, partial [Gemmatimonadaceae bacterium]